MIMTGAITPNPIQIQSTSRMRFLLQELSGCVRLVYRR